RMIGEVDLAGDADALRLGLHPLELDAAGQLVDLDVVETVIEVVMPEHAAILAVGHALQADLLLLLDDLRNLLVLNLLQIGRADLPLVALGARLGDRRRAQIAADMVGAERWLGPSHGSSPHSSIRLIIRDAEQASHVRMSVVENCTSRQPLRMSLGI